ncbi:MAG: glycosyltransferase family 4 protein [Gemmataceae bacterium]
MRIAHFIQRYSPARGGSEAYFSRLSQHLAAAGDEVTVWTTVAKDLAAFWSPQAECFSAGTEQDRAVNVRRYPLWRIRGRRWLLKPLSLLPLRAWQALTLPCNPISLRMWRDAATPSERYDAVHATAFPYAWPIMCARRLARRQNIPFLLTPFLHLGDPDNPRDRSRRAYTQPALRRLLLSADRVFAQTELERTAIIELGVPVERVVLQGLGVDPADCTGGNRQSTRRAWAVTDSEVVIGHLANLSAEKGTIDLLKATDRCQPCVVVLAGPAMPNFERFIATHQSRVRVVRLGELTDVQKRDFFAAIDIFALPSRSDSFGLVLLEAWSNGVPNVAYRAGGPGEIIRDGIDGLLAPCGQVELLAQQLSRLIASAELRQRMGRAGQARLRSEYAWDDKLQLVRSVMSEAVAENSRVAVSSS